jgi:putative oxidoreductase
MLVAIFFQQFSNGTWSMLPAMGFLWVSMFGMVLGSGRLGIDYLLTKKLK